MLSKVLLVFFLFATVVYGMEIDIIVKHDPHSIVDLLHDNGSYLKELIIAGSGVNYCHDFAIAQKTVRCFFDDIRPKGRDKFLDFIRVDWRDEEELVNSFGKEAIALAHTVVKQQKIRKALFAEIFHKGEFVYQKDQQEKLKNLIQECPSALNARRYSHQSYGGTLIHYIAAQCDWFSADGEKLSQSILKILLENEANPHMCDKYKRSPLFYALKHGCIRAVKLLLQYNVCVNMQDYEGNAPLHYAVLGNRHRKAMVFKLFSGGADVNAKNKWGETPVHFALRKNVHGRVIECLLHFSDTDILQRNRGGESCLDTAVKSYNSYFLTALLFKFFADYQSGKQKNICESVQRLIKAGADVNARNNYATYRNYKYNCIDDLRNCTVISYILHHKCKNCLNLLLQHNVDIKSRPNYSFVYWSYIDAAICYGFYDAVGILVNAGLPIWQGQGGALLSAAANKNNEAVKVLLHYGALVSESIVHHSDDGDNDDIVCLLSKAYQEEKCCICFELQEILEESGFSLGYLACKNNHRRNFICKKCHDGLKNVNGEKQCPFNCKVG